jgi:ferredoxin-NADP reductase
VDLTKWLPARLRAALKDARENLEALRRDLTSMVQSIEALEKLEALSDEDTRRTPPSDSIPAGQASEAETRPDDELRARFRDLRVVEVIRQTDDAVTVVCDNPGPDRLSFFPGQYITLLLTLDGAQVRRAYSLCSDPGAPERVAITVKRIAGGVVSNWINDHLEPGKVIRTLGPSGQFGIEEIRPKARRRLVLVGAGAGITPLYAIVRAITANEPASRVELIYGSRRWSDVIFREELARLAAERTRLHVRHVLTRPPGNWAGLRGRIAGDNLADLVPVDRRAHYYVCGPHGMMDGVVAFLLEGGIPNSRIHTERFVPQGSGAPKAGTGEVHLVRLSRSEAVLKVADTDTILDVALAANLALPSSCRMGGCGACRQRVVKGQVEMEEPNCLTDKERRKGYRLLCVGRPTAGPVEIDA